MGEKNTPLLNVKIRFSIGYVVFLQIFKQIKSTFTIFF